MKMTTVRSRWAAIGAAVAVSLGAGGIGISHAVTDSSEGPVSAFFPIEPCRLASNEAILADSSITLDGWGTTGDCTLPNDITGLAANVTAVNATQQTNIRFYADGDAVPETANLNPSPGAAPTPNAVNITLSETNGKFRVYNRFGTVAVFIDIMGYYDDHTHDDRYYTEDEVDTALALKANTADIVLPIAKSAREGNVGDITGNTVVLSVTIEAPVAGTIQIVGSALIDFPTVAGEYNCYLSSGAGTTSANGDLADSNRRTTLSADGEDGHCSTNGTHEVAAGTHIINLVLSDPGTATTAYDDATLDALYVPGGTITAQAVLLEAAVDDDL